MKKYQIRREKMVKYFIPYWGFWLLYRDEEGFDVPTVTAALYQCALCAFVVVGIIALLLG